MCSRCVEKQIPCVYQQTKHSSQLDKQDIETFPYLEKLSFGGPACPLYASSLSLGVDCDGIMPVDPQPNAAGSNQNSVVMDTTSDGDIPTNPFIDLTGNDTTPIQNQWLVSLDQWPITERPNSPAAQENVMAFQKMALFCVSSTQLPLSI